MTFIEPYFNQLNAICKEHRVDKLYLFGSYATGKNNSESDVDLVVKFKDVALENYFNNYMELKEKLISLFKNEVDLLEEQAISNPYIKASIEESKQLIYG